MRRAWAATVVLASACAELPYRPETLVLPRGASDFAVVVEAVRIRYPRFVLSDPAARRLQSAWIDVDDGAVPGRRRVTVFPVGEDRVGLVVELTWLRMSIAGTPYWSAPEADARAECELGELVRASLQAASSPPPAP